MNHRPTAPRDSRRCRTTLRELVKARLAQWDILPPPLQQEFLENERTLRYFAHVDSERRPAGGPGALRPMPSWRAGTRFPKTSAKDYARFNQFFELAPAEKQKTLGTLSD